VGIGPTTPAPKDDGCTPPIVIGLVASAPMDDGYATSARVGVGLTTSTPIDNMWGRRAASTLADGRPG